ncbi:Oidioi.mRNA.OKI2018_I69.chr2.g6223.t1.cds [Oikopleura dioica]|uniref:Oidioi.mRNA.OKI2018_I69.chr2.g6223.t1.cds n=1 Tax=Oikopleura dioica TaxID=34765 RepID=A0ABN7T668_OIKDI|nr:Oidioi.mRNA.OKI2018_I69.chr2.g6223.t1.cds [Oikopleura dioica]
MFKNTFQTGFLSVLYSLGSKPLQLWDINVDQGHVKRVGDNDISSSVIEIDSEKLAETYISCPTNASDNLGITLPYIILIQITDDKNITRRFRSSNYQSTTRIKPFICTMPLRMDDGWNQICINLKDFCKRAYGTEYKCTDRITIHSSCRLRRIYFSDRLYSEDELPAEFKLYLPVQQSSETAAN